MTCVTTYKDEGVHLYCTRERPYNCNICGDYKHDSVHFQHTRERPYKCDNL